MKKSIIILLLVLGIKNLYSQIEPGFKPNEARELAALCTSFTFLDLYGDDNPIIPKGYTKVYTSGTFGMDNKYQIYTKGKTLIFNFRGSTDKRISWLENFQSAMIPAKGVIKKDNGNFNYTFAIAPNAAVHAGYALGLSFLIDDILAQLAVYNQLGYYDIMITGHSQGGALATLLRAYLENLPTGTISSKNKFKTYAFASPMVGNAEFTEEFNMRYCNTQMCYTIINPKDPVAKLPVNYATQKTPAQNLTGILFDENVTLKQVLVESTINKLEDPIQKTLNAFTNSAQTQVEWNLGNIELPPYVDGFNFYRVANVINIEPVVYPKILKDSTILQNDSLMAIYHRTSNGDFVEPFLYKSEPFAFQHKPYHYYTQILKKYYPQEYGILEPKFLPESLK